MELGVLSRYPTRGIINSTVCWKFNLSTMPRHAEILCALPLVNDHAGIKTA
jgi:hypothetical protein